MTPAKAPRYVFIGGLHRSGTSLVNRLVNMLPGAGGITGAPVPENEGVYLQGAIPHTAQSGRPMHFATNPDEHLTEHHHLNTLATRQRLDHDWDPWFAPGLVWRVEKSPVNLTRMRLLQQLFPTSQFIVLLRHPEAVAASTAAWVDTPLPHLHDHWTAAYAQMEQDLPFLHAVMCLRYEDIVVDPRQAMRQIAAYLSLPCGSASEDITDGNAAYRDTVRMDDMPAAYARRWGYQPGLVTVPLPLQVSHPLRAVRDATVAA